MNSPDSYIEFIETTPPVAPIKFNSELHQSDQRPRRLIPLLSVMALFGLIGVVASFVYMGQARKIYESHAKIRIEIANDAPLSDREFVDFKTAEHELLIKQYNIVYRAINRDSVPSLGFIQELNKKEEEDDEFDVANAITESLEVAADPELPEIFDLTYRCPVKMDASTILRYIILTYRDQLMEQYQAAVVDRMNRLFHSRKLLEEELQIASNDIESSPEYIEMLQQKLATAKGELFDIKTAGGFAGEFHHVRFQVLEDAQEGELVWPDPLIVLPFGLGIGLIVGLVIGLFGILVSLSNPRLPN